MRIGAARVSTADQTRRAPGSTERIPASESVENRSDAYERGVSAVPGNDQWQ